MLENSPIPAFVTITADGKLIIANPNPSPVPGPQPLVSVQFDLTDQREKHFTGLNHDSTYYFYYYAVNATGVGPLSEVVSLVCW